MKGLPITFINEQAAKIFMQNILGHCDTNLINQSINMVHFQKILNNFYDKIVVCFPNDLCLKYGENSYYTKEMLKSIIIDERTINFPEPIIPPCVKGIDDGGKRITYGNNGAMREPSTGKGRYDLITPFGLERLARWYELGAQKYSDRNWEKGIPFSRYFDSAMRHMNKYMIGMTDEDHLAAACWNLLAIMHHEELCEWHLNDLPHYVNRKEPREHKETFQLTEKGKKRLKEEFGSE